MNSAQALCSTRTQQLLLQLSLSHTHTLLFPTPWLFHKEYKAMSYTPLCVLTTATHTHTHTELMKPRWSERPPSSGAAVGCLYLCRVNDLMRTDVSCARTRS